MESGYTTKEELADQATERYLSGEFLRADPRSNQDIRIPRVVNGLANRNRPSFESFSKKIRHKTQDGWELIDAVYEVFCRAREAHADGLIIDSATWLADRGFGKPVQVGQLLDGEGNPVAFTLWSPATQAPVGDVITVKDGKVVESADDSASPYLLEADTLEPVQPQKAEDKNGYAYGPARAWGVGEPQPRPGE